MNESEIFARLTALHTALVAKLGAQPYIAPSLDISGGGRCRIMLWAADSDVMLTATFGTIADTIAAAESFVANMPDPEAKARHDWHRKLGKVIDEGHALALPDAVMQPLRAGSQAMTENLIGVDG